MREFVQRQIGRRASHGTVAPTANHAWHRFIVGDVNGVIPGVELRVYLRWHIHPADLEGRRHGALGHVWRYSRWMDEGIDIPDKGCPQHGRRTAPGPRGGM